MEPMTICAPSWYSSCQWQQSSHTERELARCRHEKFDRLLWMILWMIALAWMGLKFGEAPDGWLQWGGFLFFNYDFITYVVFSWKASALQ